MMRTIAYRLMLVMVFTLPWENVLDVPGGGRVSRLVGLLVAAAWVAAVVSTGRVREPRAVHVFALLFVLWNACSLAWTVDGPATLERVLTYAQLLGLMLVVWDTVTTLGAVRQALMSYLAGCYVTVAALLAGFVSQGLAAEMNGRATVGTFHPNDVGLIVALGLPIAGYFLGDPGQDRWRWLRLAMAVGYVPLSGVAVLATGSRAGLVALLPGLAYIGYLLTRRHLGVALGMLGGLSVVAVLAFPFLPYRARLRLEGTVAALQAGDLNERQDVWAEAVRLIQDHPIVGSGGGAFRGAAVAVNKVGHNFVLALLAEVGIVGFGLYAAMLVAALLALRKVTPLLRGLWYSMFSAWLLAALLHNWEYRKQTWLLIALVAACGALSARDPDERAGTGDGARSLLRRILGEPVPQAPEAAQVSEPPQASQAPAASQTSEPSDASNISWRSP